MSLPAPWQLRECKEYPGRVYYYNPETNVSTWVRPVPFPNTDYQGWPPVVFVHHILVRHKSSVIESNRRDKSGLHRTREDAKMKIQNIYDALVRRARSFEEIAQQESDCLDTRKNGGSLGWIKRGRMPPAFDAVAFSLEVGQTSEPVETDLGWHLIMRKG